MCGRLRAVFLFACIACFGTGLHIRGSSLFSAKLHDAARSKDGCEWDKSFFSNISGNEIREKELVGRCMVNHVKEDKTSKTAEHCKSLCCTTRNCVSWQYRGDSGCMLNDDIRFGSEGRGSPGW